MEIPEWAMQKFKSDLRWIDKHNVKIGDKIKFISYQLNRDFCVQPDYYSINISNIEFWFCEDLYQTLGSNLSCDWYFDGPCHAVYLDNNHSLYLFDSVSLTLIDRVVNDC